MLEACLFCPSVLSQVLPRVFTSEATTTHTLLYHRALITSSRAGTRGYQSSMATQAGYPAVADMCRSTNSAGYCPRVHTLAARVDHRRNCIFDMPRKASSPRGRRLRKIADTALLGPARLKTTQVSFLKHQFNHAV